MKATTPEHTMVTSTLLFWIHTWVPMAKVSGARPPVPPRLCEANTPVRMAPTMPPTPCTPNTSNASSAPSMRLRPPTPQRQTIPATRPITMEPMGPTKPAAGVIATRPATAPDAAPSIEALPLCSDSGVDVHRGPTGKVECAICGQRATAPHHVGHGNVAEGEPQHGEDQHGRELDALGERAHDQRHGDGGEGGLEGDKHIFRNGGQQARERAGGDALEEQLVKTAEELA